MENRLMDRFVLADSREQLDRVDQLVNEAFRTKDRKVKSEAFAEMREIMKFTDFVGFAQSYKAITLWRALSRRKLVIMEQGIVVGSKVRNSVKPNGVGVVTGIRDDFILKIRLENGGKANTSPHEVRLVA